MVVHYADGSTNGRNTYTTTREEVPMSDATVSAAMRSDLREADERERLKHAEPKFREALKAAENIPLRTKTQYPLYLEARSITILKAIAEFDDVSVQELIRNQMDEYILTRTRKKPRGKRNTTKKRA